MLRADRSSTERVSGLSAVVITKNEAANLERCLHAVAFCEEIVVVDSGSTDETTEIAKRLGARVVEHRFQSFFAQREFARTTSTTPWILAIDADEVVTPGLAAEVRSRIESGAPDVVAYEIPFKNYFRGVWIRRAGYYPDRHVRLFLRDRCRYDPERPVHERLLCDGRVARLEGHVEHFTFGSIDRFVSKSSRYAEHWARGAFARGRRVEPIDVGVHTIGRFIRAYVFQLGFLDGGLGLVVSGLQAAEVFQKYARLWELSAFAMTDRDE